MVKRDGYGRGVKKGRGMPGKSIFSREAGDQRVLREKREDASRARYLEKNKPYVKYDGGAMTPVSRETGLVLMRTGYIRWDAGDRYVLVTETEWDAHHRDIEGTEE